MNAANPLSALSDALAEAVEVGGRSVALVNARRRIPASGVAIASNLILTADHVVEREEDLSIILPGGEELPAQLAGRDPASDLAVLKLEGEAAQPAEKAAVEARVGQLALALGRPSTQGMQASLGIVTALGGPLRTGRGSQLERYLATDAVPYPGFSGGPLVNSTGQMLGLNTSGLARARGAFLSIPASLAWDIAGLLAQHGRIRHGYLGIRSQPVELPAQAVEALQRTQQNGLLIVGIEEGSPASSGGLMIGDILVGIAGQPLNDPDSLSSRLTSQLVGQPAEIEILRGGKPLTLTVTIGER
jgi:serine protease DegQ